MVLFLTVLGAATVAAQLMKLFDIMEGKKK